METRERMINLISDSLGVSKFEVTDDKNFFNDLGADSLDMVEMMMSIENEFGIKVKDEEAGDIKTVGDLIEKVETERRKR